MFTTDNTTTSKTVMIFAPFRLNATQRKVMANGQLLNIAAPSARQQGDYLYSATVTLLREDAAVYTTAPSWAGAWRWNEPTRWTARMRDHAFSLGPFNSFKQGDGS